jgi:hypothetical protein
VISDQRDLYDQDRARMFARRYDLERDDIADITNVLAEEFGAVRLAERRAIVAHLRKEITNGWLRQEIGDAIERGEHGS